MTPYLNIATYSVRSTLPRQYIDGVETTSPGFVTRAIAIESSTLNAQLAKRIARPVKLPLGQAAPTLVASGTNPPPVTLAGRPTLGSYLMVLQDTTPGDLGAAVFRWSSDGGVTWATGLTPSAPSMGALTTSVVLGLTGLSAVFPIGTYGADNQYAGDPPVLEAVLGWITVLVDDRVMRKRGRNASDPAMVDLIADVTRVRGEIKDAADGKDGLFDLATNEDALSAISAGGPLAHSDQSPYEWVDRQARAVNFGLGRYGR